MFRLHIDIPLGMSEDEAIKESKFFVEGLRELLSLSPKTPKIQYRLGNDGDRTIRNYLIKDSEGHASTKKCVIEAKEE